MQILGRELTTDEIIRFVRDFAAQTRRHKDCHDCLYIDMALALADEVERLNRRAAPENKALTMNELIGMNGLPVWCVDGEGHGCYCLVNTDSEDCIDSESGAWCFEFYNMTGDGKHGLHISGWLAYARRPEDAK